MTGRNSPCPCGSGRKHKKCCLRVKETGAEKIGDLRYMLAGFAVKTTPRKDLEAAWRDFRDTDEPLEAFLAKPGERMAPFMDWLTKGRRFDGRTILERFEEAIAEGLADEDRRELEEIKATRYGVFEVVETRPGEGLSVVDIFSGESQEVRDVSASRGTSEWDVIAAWVAPGRGCFAFWGQARIFRPQDKDDIRTEMQAAYERERSVEPGLSWQAFLNTATPLLDRLQTRLLSEARRLFTPEGDPLCLGTAVYAVSDFPATLRALRGRRELDEDSNRMGEDDHLEEVSFDWMGELPRSGPRPQGNGLLLSTQRVSLDGSQAENRLANVVLTRAELRVECLSRRRLAAARSLVEKTAKKSLRLLREDFQTYETLDAPGRPRPSGREEKPEPALVAVQAAALLEFAEDWLHQPIPALDDRSPVEAAKDAPGRAKLTELLKIFEHRDAEHGNAQEFSTPAAPCQIAMRRLLGLPVTPELTARASRLRELAVKAGKDSDPLIEKFRKAQALHQKGRVEEALRAYESLKALLRSHRANHQLWANIGTCHLSAGRFAEGIRCLETALEIKPDYEFAATNLARARRFALRPRRKLRPKSLKSGKE